MSWANLLSVHMEVNDSHAPTNNLQKLTTMGASGTGKPYHDQSHPSTLQYYPIIIQKPLADVVPYRQR